MLLQATSAISSLQLLAKVAIAHGGVRFASSSVDVAAKVGFVGLGAMGHRMAKHLLDAGKNLVVYDSNRFAIDRLLEDASAVAAAGGPGTVEAACSPADLAETRGVSVVFTMLPGAAAARRAYLAGDGLLAASGGVVPRVLVDCTTLDPPTARELEGRVRATRISPAAGPPLPGLPPQNPALLDAPVTGGIVGADKGTLSFLVGGEAAALPAVEPLLRDMGSRVIWCGDAGDAQAARLCNTLVMAATMAATAEAMALSRRLGVDPGVMTRVLNSGSGRSWVSQEYNPVPGLTPDAPASQGYRAGHRSSQVVEHLTMALNAADKSHSPVPVCRNTLQLYSKIVEEGMGDQDFASIYRYVYGSGSSSHEWRSGEQLFNSTH
ncbi:hypothetical protein VOLCADRAFT_118095 [Volvox carteri f. nagariensis]|uniref:3-hydroxyisobutyrate dehydrogenase n=1 Tax=Volvox carteri f. nagariensis TaxID=3068 RepID=D8U131_VOLCA|nr:uncharacterized protein VOLCADRAFT_118095 [Volvox carteri f. nagariensis]EFJ46488.1 hypothetical protein VOLCADRAFT_118095 [Volvox carteri f. nagariensis]|eukprot:XP_002952345.1 hypothetical protein VOLCADRAFT_118095 [Volvox carteri f. nagariensis]